MKITKAKLKQIIKEELSTLKEVEYVEPSEVGERTPDDTEVHVPGYGGLKIGQIRNRVQEKASEFERTLELSNLLAGGIVEAFIKTLKDHNALESQEEKHSIDTQAIGE